MKATADSNELVFTLRVAPDTRNASALKSFGDQVIKEQKRIHDAGSSSMKTGKSPLLNFGIPDERELAKASAAQLRHHQRQAEANKKALDREEAAVKKAADAKIKEAKRAADEQIREAKRAADAEDREADRLHRRHRERQLSRATRNRASRQASITGWGDVSDVPMSWAIPHEDFARSRGSAGRASSLSSKVGAVNNLLDAGGNLARGVAYSGMVGEKDSQKVLDTLMKIEGGIALLHTGGSLLKGAGGLGMFGSGGGAAAMAPLAAVAAPVGAFVAAVAGAAAAINGIKRQITGEANHPDSYEMKIGKATATLGNWDYRAGRWLGIYGENSTHRNRGLVESEDRVEKAEKKKTKREKEVETHIASDNAFATRAFADNDRAAYLGFRTARTDQQKLGVIGRQLKLENSMDEGLADRQQSAIRSGDKGEIENILKLRETAEERIFNLNEQQRDIQIKTGREALELSKSRAESEADIARQAFESQAGIAKDLAGQLKSDMAKYGRMDPLERMRTDAAAMAFKSGNATKEQEDRLSGFHGYREQIEAAQARRGMATGGLNFDRELANDAKTATAEAERRLAASNEANLKVQTEHKLMIKFEEGAGFDQTMAAQIEDFVQEAIAKKDREDKKAMDDLRRELAGERRIRATLAGR